MAIKIAEYLNNNLREVLVKLNKYQLGLNHNAHQLTSSTKTHRYPAIFNSVKQEYVKSNKVPESIMSFGCSTGEECLTIQQYFPCSKITGVDINQKNLKKCRKTIQHKNIKFLYSDPKLMKSEAPYDIIFCMSVLCRWEETEFVKRCDKIYPFEKFEQQTKLLNRLLIPGGLLVIYNSNFQFCDTDIYPDYLPIPVNSLKDSGFVHKFDKGNRKIDNDYSECVLKNLNPNILDKIRGKNSYYVDKN